MLKRLAALLVLAPALLAVAAAAEPLTDEDVVRRFAGGASEAELVRLVREHDAVDFDLSPDMLRELRLAGLPESVIQAMLARMPPPAPPTTPTPEPGEERPGLVTLTVRLHAAGRDSGEESPAPTLKLPTRIPPPLAATLRLGPEVRLRGAAVVLLCRTQDHVPDHWRNESPLGRDFYNTPRHRLLAFAPGVAPAAGGEGSPAAPSDVLELELPRELQVAIEPHVAHDLGLGLAFEIGDRWLLMREDRRDAVVLESDLELTAVLRRGGPTEPPELRFEPGP